MTEPRRVEPVVADQSVEGTVEDWPPPTREALTRGLATVLCLNESEGNALTVVDRAPNPYGGTASSEVVTCRTAHSEAVRVLCKYGHPKIFENSHGHRGGIAYEAGIYRNLLGPLGVSVPHCYGTHEDRNENQTWLILEYLDQTLRLDSCVDPEASMASAAGWLGDFHARTERALQTQTLPLMRYHAEYYRGWARRTLDFARAGRHMSPWLRELCEHPEGFIAPLVEAPHTVIHGEFYPKNILSHEGRIFPVDWETAALGPAEVDLASLVERWRPEIVSRCEEEYSRTRCASGPPHDFERGLTAARVYWQLRWLGDRPEWLDREGPQWRFAALREAGERLGII